MQNHCIAREKNISSAFYGVWFYFWKLLYFLVVLSICGFVLAAVSVVPVTPAQGHLFIQGWRKALGSSDMEEASFQLFHLWDEGRTTGATPAVCFHPPWHASERAWISVRINVIFSGSLANKSVCGESDSSICPLSAARCWGRGRAGVRRFLK